MDLQSLPVETLPSMPMPDHVTALLVRAGAGDHSAASTLFDLLYGELRARARAILRDDRGLTLQPTALVHEAWLKLVPGGAAGPRDRAHFLRLAAAAMRSVLVDHARARNADKRGGGARRQPIDELCDVFAARATDLVVLDDALRRLHDLDPMLAQIVELRFFAGLEVAEVAATLAVSASTVERAWRTARSWLRAELDPR